MTEEHDPDAEGSGGGSSSSGGSGFGIWGWLVLPVLFIFAFEEVMKEGGHQLSRATGLSEIVAGALFQWTLILVVVVLVVRFIYRLIRG